MPRLSTMALAALLLSGAVSAAGTTLYRWVDDQGVVHYSDSPQPGAQKISIQPVQTYKATPPPGSGSTYGGSSSGASTRNVVTPISSGPYACSISSPQTDQSFFAPDGVPVSVSVTPGMQDGDLLLVSLDGQSLPPSSSNAVTIPQPVRGSHSVSAIVRGADGSTRCSAAPVIFSVQRPSALSPQSPQAQSPTRGH